MNTARVLLVEDDALVRMVLVETLEDAGFHVTEAAKADDALPLLERSVGFDVLVTDIQMPGRLDGVALARVARDLQPGLPVIYVTGRPDLFGGSRRLGGSDALVGKPYRPEQIVQTVARVLRQSDRPTTDQSGPSAAARLQAD